MQTLSLGGYHFDPVLAAALGKKALIIAIILIVTWLLAKAAKWSFAKLVDRVPLFQRAAASGESIGSSLGRIVSLFIWLFGLVAVLQALDLNSVIAPVQGLINSFVAFVPKVLGAGIIFFVGGMIAKIVRDIIPNAHVATVYAKPLGRPLVDTFVTEVSQDTWIYFPWDMGLAYQAPISEDHNG